MRYATWGPAVVAGLYCLHRIGIWAERRGWIYYRKKHGSSGALGNALLEMQAILEPSQRYVLEERTKGESDTQDAGDPPVPAARDAVGQRDARGGVEAVILSSEVLGVEYGVAEASDLDEVARLLAVVFCQHDPPAVATGLTPAEFEDFVQVLCPRAAADGLTIVGRSAQTGEMVGALLTEDSAAPPPSGIERLSRKFAPIFDILGQLDAEYRQDKGPTPGESLHLFLLGVAQAFGGRRVAQQLVSACLENGVRKGYRLAVTEATNSVSQHIFRKLGFADRVQRSYRDHRFEGRACFASIAGHTGPILMDRMLDPAP